MSAAINVAFRNYASDSTYNYTLEIDEHRINYLTIYVCVDEFYVIKIASINRQNITLHLLSEVKIYHVSNNTTYGFDVLFDTLKNYNMRSVIKNSIYPKFLWCFFCDRRFSTFCDKIVCVDCRDRLQNMLPLPRDIIKIVFEY